MQYNPSSWYWQVAGSTTQVYASASLTYVSVTDAAYVAWLAAGGFASRVETEAELAEILQGYGLPLGLQGYANTKQWALATGGYSVTIGTTTATWATDTVSLGLVTGQVVDFQQASGAPASVAWQFAAGFQTIQSADFIAAAAQVNAFIRATFTTLQGVLAGITAGTITTTAQINAAAWPSNVSATPA